MHVQAKLRMKWTKMKGIGRFWRTTNDMASVRSVNEMVHTVGMARPDSSMAHTICISHPLALLVHTYSCFKCSLKPL